MAIYGRQRLIDIIHESGHAQDLAAGTFFTDTGTWKQAMTESTCRNWLSGDAAREDYANGAKILAYNFYRGNKYGKLDTTCIDLELKAQQTYVNGLDKANNLATIATG